MQNIEHPFGGKVTVEGGEEEKREQDGKQQQNYAEKDRRHATLLSLKAISHFGLMTQSA